MSSRKADNHVPPISSKTNQFNSDSNIGYTCHSSNNLPFPVGPSLSNINNSNGPIINNNSMDKSNLLAMSMINQAINFSLLQQNSSNKQLKISPPLHYPDSQKFNENKMPSLSNPNPFVVYEYQKIKQLIDKSGILLPNEKLVTQNRGECYWANCFFQSDIEENFKKHLNDCHHVTLSTIGQLEISFEKAKHLSQLLVKEQNHLYNMLLHLDQKLKSLPCDSQLMLTDNHYLLALLNKFKQMPNVFESFNENRFVADQNSFQQSHRLDGQQFSLNDNTHQTQQPAFLQQQSSISFPSLSNIPQQLIDNISSALLRQQQQLHPKTVPLSCQTANHQPTFQSSSPQLSSQPNHVLFNNSILPLITNNNPNINNNLLINNSDSLNVNSISPTNQLSNIDSNLKDILSQSRSSDSNYPRSDPESNSLKDNKIKPAKRSSSNSQLSFFPKGMTDREYYRQFPVRPSASYVNLIKTAILESPRRELSLNEIYVWMQTEFAYFRDKEQKWKNAIRHNLSLHKCFQRKHGKLWTFNENEYNMKKSRNRFQYNVSVAEAENQTNDPDSFEDEDEMQEQLEHSEYVIKKEMDFNDENIPDEKGLETDEWSNYLHKTSLITSTNDESFKPPDISVD